MYLSLGQIEAALVKLEKVHPFFGMAYLAFKKADIPVGNSADYVFNRLATDILERYYKISADYGGFYNPFITSDKGDRWIKPRYPSTSLQRITTDTFGDALIHVKKSSAWGWEREYVSTLRAHLHGKQIPAFELAVWLYRQKEWADDITPREIRNSFFEEFNIRGRERDVLFDDSRPEIVENWLSHLPVTEDELLEMIGSPPGAKPAQGAAVSLLELRDIGPANIFKYEPAERLNIITGDNSLGKTFILESLWWSLTGAWLDNPILPNEWSQKSHPKIICTVKSEKGRNAKFESTYLWEQQEWSSPKKAILPGLVIYARHDGSFAVWDPSKVFVRDPNSVAHLFFRRADIWNGVEAVDKQGKPQWLCNGLIRDWVTWQTGGPRYSEQFSKLISCLKALSPNGVEPLLPGEPVRLPGDTREFPTLKMPYGDVPVTTSSAGVQRIIALAYILVWAWNEHLANSSLIKRPPQRRLILIVDEIEAHLHPRWQRVIVPALMNVISRLSSSVTPQTHLATHSPLVMASAEPIFDEGKDDLHHLELIGEEVKLGELAFVKRGRADYWLMSDVFGLTHARSLPAEETMEKAKALQLMDDPPHDVIRQVNKDLVRYLAPDDEFWVRWRYFAKRFVD